MRFKGKIHMFLTLLVVTFIVGCGGSPNYNSSVVGSSPSNDDLISNEANGLAVGDISYITFDSNGDATVDFTTVSSDAQFMFIIQSYSQSSSSFSATFGDESVLPNKGVGAYLSENETKDAAGSFNLMLRGEETYISESEDYVEVDPNVSKAVFKASASETFRVLSSISSTSQYQEVDAEIYCTGDNVIFYVDEQVETYLSNDLTEADVDELCVNFDAAIDIEYDSFGEASDVNGDGKIAVLMTPAVNELGAMGGGIITGYFYAGDLYARTTSNVVSNEREILYVMVPDPDGLFGTAIPKDFALTNLLPAVLPHELQHAISYNNHVFVYHSSSESTWLNEAISHLSEDLTGYNRENPSRYEMYLQEPANYSLVTSTAALQNRGAGYLFMRYLYERSSNQEEFLYNLHHTDLTGVDNVEAAFAGTDENFDEFYEFFRRWSVALALTDSGIAVDSKYVYNPRTVNATTGNWDGVCLRCDADDGRGTILTGPEFDEYVSGGSISVKGTASRFYQLNNMSGQTITVNGSASADLGGVLIRIE